MCGEKNWQVCVQMISDYKSEKLSKIGARLTKSYPPNSSALALVECQAFQMCLT